MKFRNKKKNPAKLHTPTRVFYTEGDPGINRWKNVISHINEKYINPRLFEETTCEFYNIYSIFFSISSIISESKSVLTCRCEVNCKKS